MDVDMDDIEEEVGDDGEEPHSNKRAQGNSGAVIAKGSRAPRTNRQLAGFRDHQQASKAIRLRNLGRRERNMHAKAGESDRAIRVKKVFWLPTYGFQVPGVLSVLSVFTVLQPWNILGTLYGTPARKICGVRTGKLGQLTGVRRAE